MSLRDAERSSSFTSSIRLLSAAVSELAEGLGSVCGMASLTSSFVISFLVIVSEPLLFIFSFLCSKSSCSFFSSFGALIAVPKKYSPNIFVLVSFNFPDSMLLEVSLISSFFALFVLSGFSVDAAGGTSSIFTEATAGAFRSSCRLCPSNSRSNSRFSSALSSCFWRSFRFFGCICIF